MTDLPNNYAILPCWNAPQVLMLQGAMLLNWRNGWRYCLVVLHDTMSSLTMEERAKYEFEDVTPYWLRLFLHNGEEPQ